MTAGDRGKRIVVTGATGNAGTSVLQVLAQDASIAEIVGVARRLPTLRLPRTRFVAADVARDDLVRIFRGADAVIHLAWLIQPSRDRTVTRAVNVEGSRRVFDAVALAGVPRLVHASSVGAYSAGPKDRRVDESWPTGGTATSFYSVDKATVEGVLDDFEASHPDVAVVRLRPGLIFKRDAASGIRRLFAGPLLPSPLVRTGLIPVLPLPRRLVIQGVHSLDIAEAYRLAATTDVRGAFNIAAEPVLDPAELGRLLGARTVPIRAGVLRRLVDLTWKLRLQPTPPGWLDMALAVPVMDTTRAQTELGWHPSHTSGGALLELLGGMRDGAGMATEPLKAGGDWPLRLRELRTGVGARSR